MKVLAISNSFGVDANRYLYQIARADGVDLQVVTLYIGGCSLEKHYRNMIGDRREYELYYNGMATGFFVTMEEALLSRCWDVITLQQASHFSPIPSTYEPYATSLYDYVKECQPKAKILIHQTWAYEDGTDKLNETGLSYEQMHLSLKQAYARVATELGGIVVAVGDRFAQYKLEHPEINLYKEDHFHPSLEGTELVVEEFVRAILAK